ncbi:hypothetical protein HAX54_027348 [Datura stramonium]|uniref:Uncharacterized protein n=1 Tax=Datura stramonium TaxID=4076 RepID=A0ABS8V4A6_DATST|nr:hypothetical protein [Datura stramonium]
MERSDIVFYGYCQEIESSGGGRSRSENVVLSNANIGENPMPQKPKGSSTRFVHGGLFGLEIPICLLLSLAVFLGGCSSLLSNSNSARGQPAAEQPTNLPPSPDWTTIFKEYSVQNSVGSSEASVNQSPLIPELHTPLLDDDIHRAELAGRLRILLWGKPYRKEIIDSVVDTQVQIEKHIQVALVERDYSVESLLAKRH